MRPRSLALGALLLLSATAEAAAAPTARRSYAGEVVTAAGQTVLLRGGSGAVVGRISAGTSLEGIQRLDQLQPGDRVELEGRPGPAGIVEVETLAVAPPWRLAQPAAAIGPELAAVGLVVPAGTARAHLPIDVRPRVRWEDGHLPGAVSAPLDGGLAELAKAIPDRSRRLLVYSEDARCPLAPQALRALTRMGFTDVQVLEGGFRAWWNGRQRSVVEPRGLARALKRGERLTVVDVRGAAQQAAGGVPGALAMGDLEVGPRRFAGRAVEPPVVLVAADADDATADEVGARIEGFRRAWESPADAPVVILSGGLRGWRDAGGTLAGVAREIPDDIADARRGEIGLSEFDALWTAGAGASALLLDVRPADVASPAWALHVPLEELPTSLARIPKDRQVVTFCSVGRRSAIAYEILKANGYRVRFLRGSPPR